MITQMQDIVAQAAPEEVTLSGFKPNTEITVLLHSPSLYALIAENALPNPLLPVVNKLFSDGPQAQDVSAPDAEFARALRVIARETLVTPTISELDEAGVQLTDRQLLEISVYATRGPATLAAFRSGMRATTAAHVAPVQNDAEQPDAPDRSTDGVVRR